MKYIISLIILSISRFDSLNQVFLQLHYNRRYSVLKLFLLSLLSNRVDLVLSVYCVKTNNRKFSKVLIEDIFLIFNMSSLLMSPTKRFRLDEGVEDPFDGIFGPKVAKIRDDELPLKVTVVNHVRFLRSSYASR